MENIKNSNVLVVGGAGFVGANLVKKLVVLGAGKVTVVDNLLSAEKENLPDSESVYFIQGSITDDTVLKQLSDDFDYAFQLSTYHGNQRSIADPLSDHENNTFTTLKFCEHFKEFKRLKKVVYSSAGCTVAEKTFDDVQATQEDAPVSLHLDSPYQISKIIGELYFNYYSKQYGMPVVKARFQNVYGPGEVLGAGQWRGTPATVWRNVTPTFVYRALKQMPLTVENDGIATRDFIYVEDIVDGLIACAVQGEPGGVYNLASGRESSIRDLADTINRLTENPIPVTYLPARDWDRSGKRFGSTGKAKKEIGFEAVVGLDQGLSTTIAWTRKHMDFIDSCIARHLDKMPGGKLS